MLDGHICTDHEHLAQTFFDMTASAEMDEMIARMIAQVYDQKLQAGDVYANVWKATTEQYWKAIKEGYDEIPFYSKLQHNILELRRNVNTFAAFKNHANVFEMTLLLTDDEGRTRTFSQFKKLALQISEKYNVNWLEAEYNLALRSAQAAAQWQRFVVKGGKLEYKTIGDGRVRDEHRILDGAVYPVNHPFWESYYPPNGWNCRCFVRWRPDDTADVVPQSVPEVSQMFRNNVGITGQIFTTDHPFIKEIDATQADKIFKMAEQETMRFERKYVYQAVKEGLSGKSVPVQIGEATAKITFSNKGLKEAINQPHVQYVAKNRAILNIREMLKGSQYIGARMAVDDIAVKQFHYFSIMIEEKESFIVIKEMYSGEFVFYTIVDKLK